MSTDKLFDLISRMTKSEKRYFTLNARKFTDKTNNYLKLFNALNEMESYDEGKLLKKSKKDKFINNLTSEKNYLYDALLDSLRSFNKKKSPKAQVRELLLDASFLRSRGLYQQCNKVLQKAKRLAEYNEFYILLLDIISTERLLPRYILKRKIAEKIKAIDDEWLKVYKLIREEYRYFDFYNQCLYTLNFDKVAKEEEYIIRFEELFGSTLEEDKVEETHSKRVNFYRFMSIITYYGLRGDHVRRNEYYDKFFKWIEINQEVKEIMLHDYRVFLLNYLNVFLQSNDWSEFNEIANEIRSLRQDDLHQESATNFSIIYYELIYCMNICEFAKAKELVDESEIILKKYKGTITISTELGFKVNIAILYFVLEDFEKSLEYINSIILSSEKENRKDILRFGRMFEVVLHFELRNTEIFESIFRSSVRYFKNHQVEYKFELLVLDYVNKAQKAIKSEEKDILAKLKGELLRIKKEKGGQSQAGLEEILIWIESKITEQPATKILQDQVENDSKL